jgi:hypothetical protein
MKKLSGRTERFICEGYKKIVGSPDKSLPSRLGTVNLGLNPALTFHSYAALSKSLDFPAPLFFLALRVGLKYNLLRYNISFFLLLQNT